MNSIYQKLLIALFCGLLSGCNDNLCRHYVAFLSSWWLGSVVLVVMIAGWFFRSKSTFIGSGLILIFFIILKFIPGAADCNMGLG